MSVFLAVLEGVGYAVVAAVLLTGMGWLVRKARRGGRQLRRYTLLGTADENGDQVLHDTTLSTGSVIGIQIDGRRAQFELTGALMRDGTYAAEPLTR